MSYVELQVTTNFSFLRGASHPQEMVEAAATLGYSAIAVTDRNTFAGIVRAHAAAKKRGNIRLIVGCRLDLLDGPSLLAYPTNNKAYANLCELLTTGNLRTEKGSCELYVKDVLKHAEGSRFILLPPALGDDLYFPDAFIQAARTYKTVMGHHLYLSAARYYNGDDQKYLYQLAQLAEQESISLVATNDVHYHHPQRRELQDIITCIREKCTIYNAGFLLHPNAERFLKTPPEMIRLFRQYPAAIKNVMAIAEACTFSLDELTYRYPSELTVAGRTPMEELAHLAWKGAHDFYGKVIPEKVERAIKYELPIIERLDCAYYFLTVYDLVQFAKSRGILCQGRGSAANSAVCFCLGITSVNPEKFDLLFERFFSPERNEPPDIDVDFEHERREEVIQYIYEKYGRDRAAIVATVTQQHQKGSIRDVAKAMGLSLDAINRLSNSVWELTNEWFEDARIQVEGFNPNDAHLRKVLELTKAFMGFPRQLGQHTGGFVITDGKLTELCPVLNARMENRTCIEWNKDDIDALGFMKVDVLALGMLTCIRKAFDIAKEHYGLDLTLANIPQDDPAVYEMISRADTIGVFQIESRAQQTMLPRLKPACFYDLVIEVAIVRPGPIQGNMVHPYLRRRNGEEAVEYPSKELEDILGRTLGVPLFQEQAMKIAIVAAGFTPSEADNLRRSIATFKLQGLVTQFRDKLISGMTGRGYSLDYAKRIFNQLEGFGSYGFPESHAASFALLVYVSSWLKCHYPDVFTCALLNSLPMGFYQPAQIVADARKHGVEIRPVDVNLSVWDHRLEEKSGKYFALRLGFRIISGIRQEDITRLIAARVQPFISMEAVRNTGISNATLEKLADADCFNSLGHDRRTALWELSTKDTPEALFANQQAPDGVGENVTLTAMENSEHVVQDYATTALSLKGHPVSFVREKLSQFGIMPAEKLSAIPDGTIVRVAGLVLMRQRPGTAGGVCFMTIEDETGVANLIIFASLFDEFRKPILQARLIVVQGKVQKNGDVIHVVAISCHDFSKLLRTLVPGRNKAGSQLNANQLSLPLGKNKQTQVRMKGDENSFPEARNFR